jgi:hypothetical protein
MNHVLLIASSSLLLVACGGKSPPPAGGGGSTEAPAAAAIPAGIHGCQFVVEGYAYGPHRCDIAGSQFDKLSGMELFSGTLAETADGVVLTAKATCSDMATACDETFTVTMKKEGASWRGPVAAQEGSTWWLAGATFEVDHPAGYGGEGYGGAMYGGE